MICTLLEQKCDCQSLWSNKCFDACRKHSIWCSHLRANVFSQGKFIVCVNFMEHLHASCAPTCFDDSDLVNMIMPFMRKRLNSVTIANKNKITGQMTVQRVNQNTVMNQCLRQCSENISTVKQWLKFETTWIFAKIKNPMQPAKNNESSGETLRNIHRNSNQNHTATHFAVM